MIEDARKCLICYWSGEIFLPFGIRKREDCLCPQCQSLERHRLIWLYLKQKTNFFTQKLSMLHVAPEPQLSKRFMELENIDYLSADLNLKSAMVKMDICNIQYPDDTFDVIYANHVLEHIPDDIKAMKELYRVLKPSGWAILQVPISGKKTLEDLTITSPEERERLYGLRDHVRVYGHDGIYKNRLESAGFKVKIDPYARNLPEEIIKRYGILKSEDIYFLTKS